MHSILVILTGKNSKGEDRDEETKPQKMNLKELWKKEKNLISA